MVIGGPAAAISETIAQLDNEFAFYLVTGDPLPDEMDASVLLANLPRLEVIRLHGMKRAPGLLRDVRAYFRLKKIFKRIRPDVVHTHGAKPGLLGRLAAKATKVPVVLHTYHGHIFHSYFNRFVSSLVVRAERWLAKKTTAIIAISEHGKQELAHTYHIAPEKKIITIPLLLNLNQFADANGKQRSAFRQQYQVQQQEIAIGIVGRLTPVKNMQLFVRVVQLLLQENKTQYRFFIIGDGAEKPQLQQQFRTMGITQTDYTQNPVTATVTFTSWLLNTADVMNGLDVVCLTSLNEGTPVSLIEAQAASTPVVSTGVGSIPEIITDGEGGFLTRVNHAEDFASRVQQLALSRELREQMGKAGFQKIHQLYHPERARELTRQVYNGHF